MKTLFCLVISALFSFNMALAETPKLIIKGSEKIEQLSVNLMRVAELSQEPVPSYLVLNSPYSLSEVNELKHEGFEITQAMVKYLSNGDYCSFEIQYEKAGESDILGGLMIEYAYLRHIDTHNAELEESNALLRKYCERLLD